MDNENQPDTTENSNVHDENSVSEGPLAVETLTVVEDEGVTNDQDENSATVESDAAVEASILNGFPYGPFEFSENDGPLLDQNIEESEYPLGPCKFQERYDPILNQHIREIISLSEEMS
ncbi:14506_t:CDS:1 [Racocetra fulgida]|uniref:14506_t:CDS:1 n=1 Tax=Racocetra fulgida TaxID=60492 RepID=A0A9N8YY09_9GLOM|nr:14506_t:CDS:1 [Racocetra fulgida]